jgi:hypothetical protein
MPGLCYIRGGVLKNVARAQGPILTCYSIAVVISSEAFSVNARDGSLNRGHVRTEVFAVVPRILVGARW